MYESREECAHIPVQGQEARIELQTQWDQSSRALDCV